MNTKKGTNTTKSNELKELKKLLPISSFHEVGVRLIPETIEKITKFLGIRIIDILKHIPINYEIWQKVGSLDAISVGENCCVSVVIDSANFPPFYLAKKRHLPATIKCHTQDGKPIKIMFFNYYSSMVQMFQEGKNIVCMGKLSFDKTGGLCMVQPRMSKRFQEIQGTMAVFKLSQLEENGVDLSQLQIDAISPIYSLTDGLKQEQLIKLISAILSSKNLDISSLDCCDDLFENVDLPDVFESFKHLHFPQNIADIEFGSKYRKKLALLELISFQSVLSEARKNRESESGLSIIGNGKIAEKILKNLPFELTEDQQKCITEIKQDQASPKKMLRILQGDVGSGKTLVALMSAINTIEAGYKVIVMAPTAILAKQHYLTFSNLLYGTGLQAELLIGETKQKQRNDIISRLKMGMVDVLIGTHTLFQKSIEMPKNIGLFIIDEQHNFGVEQRVDLINKCKNADILMMSATPIPRTMVMALYGDVAVSQIEHKPSNRMPIETRIISSDRYDELVKSIKRKVDNGEKAYWVCPLVDESEKLDYIDAKTRAEALQQVFGKENVGLIHGKMKQEQKDQMMLDFKNGKFNLLVATTVIEVGIDVPEATIIVIENAEKFGLAQLHQLRGRVGRGSQQSYCFLLYGEKLTEIGQQRLKILRNNNDGFKIAEYDLKMRGGGVILSSRQSGFNAMEFVNFARDKDLVRMLNNIDLCSIPKQKLAPIIDIFNHQMQDGKSWGEC